MPTYCTPTHLHHQGYIFTLFKKNILLLPGFYNGKLLEGEATAALVGSFATQDKFPLITDEYVSRLLHSSTRLQLEMDIRIWNGQHSSTYTQTCNSKLTKKQPGLGVTLTFRAQNNAAQILCSLLAADKRHWIQHYW